MLDLHCHILPGVDDGAADEADTLAMARVAVATGCRAVCASSHLYEGLFSTSADLLETEHANVVRLLAREKIPLEVFPGAENFLGPMTAAEFAEKAVPLGPGRRYVLFDFAMDELVPHVGEAVEALARRDRVALIAHPERNRVLQADPRPVAEWIAAGARIQVNAGSVLGRLGEGALHSAHGLLEAGAVHALASDAHGVGKRRPFCLDAGRDAAAEIVGPDGAERLTRENPWRIARGEPVEAGPVSFDSPRGGRFWKRLLGGP